MPGLINTIITLLMAITLELHICNSIQKPTRYLASDAIFGVETPDGATRSDSSSLTLLLFPQTLSSADGLAPWRGLWVALRRDAMAAGDFESVLKGGGKESMTTRITQIEEQEGGDAILRVEGWLSLEDAKLLEKVCHDLRERNGGGVRVDLSGLSFLEEESASLLCRLKGLPGVELEGARLFVRQVIEQAERNGRD